jgi:hypothetical protein
VVLLRKTVVSTRRVVRRSVPVVQKVVYDVSLTVVADTIVHHKVPTDILDFFSVETMSLAIEHFLL